MISNRHGQWRDRAACRGVDSELFFPTAESGPVRTTQVAAAKAVCARCPVRGECLDEALARIPYGVAGGLTEHERRTLRRSASASNGGRKVTGTGIDVELLPGPTARERARFGRRLLGAGRTTSQVARVCGVSTRTVQRWAGEGSTAATGLPSGSPEHITS